MKKWLACLLTLACSTSATPAWGCDVYSSRTPDSTCVVMELDERSGVWFDLETADGLRKLKLEYPELKKLLKDYKRSESLGKFQAERYREAWTLTRGVVADLQKSQRLYVRQAREAREARNAAIQERNVWYRSPVLWTGVGMTFTLGVGALVVYGLGKL